MTGPEPKNHTRREGAQRHQSGGLPPPALITTTGFNDFELLDSGGGRKLERFGRVVVDRPEPQAIWRKSKADKAWQGCDAAFRSEKDDDESDGGRWKVKGKVPEVWPVRVMDVTLLCRLMNFRHMGIFPEQLPHWQWMGRQLEAVTTDRPRVLNLFAYTGAASLIAAKLGAEVTHVDASKKAIAWAKENQAASGLEHAPIRWILDDARKFVAREVRRKKSYHVILVDPPKFGRGPGNEVWDLFTHLPPLMQDCAALRDPHASSLVLTVYAIRASTLSFFQLARECLADRTGQFDYGELAIAPKAPGNAVPTSLFTRWNSNGPE